MNTQGAQFAKQASFYILSPAKRNASRPFLGSRYGTEAHITSAVDGEHAMLREYSAIRTHRIHRQGIAVAVPFAIKLELRLGTLGAVPRRDATRLRAAPIEAKSSRCVWHYDAIGTHCMPIHRFPVQDPDGGDIPSSALATAKYSATKGFSVQSSSRVGTP
jgi:hypothetical protein